MKTFKFKKYFFILFGAAFIAFVYILNLNRFEAEQKISLDFHLKLRNIMKDEKILKVSAHRQIFFIESHMEEVRKMDKPRAACAVESAGQLTKKFMF